MFDLLAHLDGVRQNGAGRWLARCPGPIHSNGDRHPSLSVRLIEGDRWLLYCFAGCSAFDVCNAIGIEFWQLFHDGLIRREYTHGKDRAGKPVPRIRAGEFLELAAHEVLVASLIINDVLEWKPIERQDWERLAEAYRKLSNARVETLG